jgi:hypothetical protein
MVSGCLWFWQLPITPPKLNRNGISTFDMRSGGSIVARGSRTLIELQL